MGVDVSVAVAGARSANNAYIDGGSYNAKNVSVTANTISTVDAAGRTAFQIEAMSIGALLTDARATDTVKAAINNVSLIDALGTVDAKATGSGNAEALSENAGSVSFANLKGSSAKSMIGSGDQDRQTVWAGTAACTRRAKPAARSCWRRITISPKR